MAIGFDPNTLGKFTAYRVPRDGARDLIFKGWEIGQGRSGSGSNSGFAKDWTRGVVVTIYLTTGRRYVVHTKRWSHWQNEHDRHSASRYETPKDLLAGLHDEGELYTAEKEAWEAACDKVPDLEDLECEQVD